MVHTAREWVDAAQLVMPGYRDRIGVYELLQVFKQTSPFGATVRCRSRSSSVVPIGAVTKGRAGEELAGSVLAGMRNVGLPGQAPVAMLGKVFASGLVRSAFAATLARSRTDPQLVAAHNTGLDGAASLPTVRPASALAARIRTARKA